MEGVKAYSTFINEEGNIYRIDAYLQFGEGENILGACIMCNPGGARLSNEREWQRVLNNNGVKVTGVNILDPTMEHLIRIIKEANGGNVEGKFLIYNLFTLRNSKMDLFVKKIPSLYSKEVIRRDLETFTQNLKEVPFCILGWGCSDNRYIKDEEKKWVTVIENNEVPYIGVLGKKQYDYYHIRPLIKETCDMVKGKLIEDYKEFLMKKL